MKKVEKTSSEITCFVRQTPGWLAGGRICILKHQYLQGKPTACFSNTNIYKENNTFYVFISIFTRFSNISLLILRNSSARDSQQELVRLWTTVLPGGSRPGTGAAEAARNQAGWPEQPQRQTTRPMDNGRLTKKILYANKKLMPIYIYDTSVDPKQQYILELRHLHG